MLTALEACADGDGKSVSAVTEAAGLPLSKALLAYAEGDCDQAVDLLLPIRHGLGRLGGSHAQRDVFALTLIAACVRSGRLELARTLLEERVERRPRSPMSLRWLARVLETLGDAKNAGAARGKANELTAG